jgi:hypothetical protein
MITSAMITHGLGQDLDNFLLFGLDVHQETTGGPEDAILFGRAGYHVFRLIRLGVGFVTFDISQITQSRSFTFPDENGTLATVENIHHIDWQYGDITADVDGATITFDMELTDKHTVTLEDDRTLAVENVHVGQTFTLILVQDATGSRTVTWFSGISWPGGTPPTLTATANKRDVFQFLCISSGVYLGSTVGLNY